MLVRSPDVYLRGESRTLTVLSRPRFLASARPRVLFFSPLPPSLSLSLALALFCLHSAIILSLTTVAFLGCIFWHAYATYAMHRRSALMGLSVCWWKSDHNTHHVVCNAVEHDPNIQHMPMIAVTEKIFQNPFWDTYHKKTVAMDAVAKFLVSWQHVLFYPLMALGRWNLYAQGFIFLLSNHDLAHYKWTELTALTSFFVWFFKLAFSMPTIAEAVAYVFVSHGVAGLLHVQIVLSHWSMETYKGTPYTSKETEWHLMQLRCVYCSGRVGATLYFPSFIVMHVHVCVCVCGGGVFSVFLTPF